jgi:hypothetical protein
MCGEREPRSRFEELVETLNKAEKGWMSSVDGKSWLMNRIDLFGSETFEGTGGLQKKDPRVNDR